MDKLKITQEQGLFILIIFWISIRAVMILFRSNKEQNFNKGLMVNILAIYICYVLSKVIFPITLQFTSKISYKGPIIVFNLFESFKDMSQGGGINGFIEYMVTNMFLLTPMIFLLLMLYTNNFDGISRVIMLSFIIAFSIEGLQLIESIIIPTVSKSVSISDLFVNTLSGLWGWVMYKTYIIITKLFTWMKKSLVL